MSAKVRTTLALSSMLGLAHCDPAPAPEEKSAAKAEESSDPGSSKDAADSKHATGSKTRVGAAREMAPGSDKGAVPAAKKAPPGSLGSIKPGAVIAWADLMLQGPEPTEALLGEPTASTGDGGRISCVRFVPDRVFFACKQETRTYAGLEGKFDSAKASYEDGQLASLALIGPKLEGAFELEQALAFAGFDFPGGPSLQNPSPPMNAESSDKVDLYSFWNGATRLKLGERQFRAEISTINGEWARTKIDLILNDPLNEAEKSRIKKPRGG